MSEAAPAGDRAVARLEEVLESQEWSRESFLRGHEARGQWKSMQNHGKLTGFEWF